MVLTDNQFNAMINDTDSSIKVYNSENIQKPAIIDNENSTKSHNELTNTQGTILGL